MAAELPVLVVDDVICGRREKLVREGSSDEEQDPQKCQRHAAETPKLEDEVILAAEVPITWKLTVLNRFARQQEAGQRRAYSAQSGR